MENENEGNDGGKLSQDTKEASRFSDSLFKSVNGEKIGIDEETYGSTSFDATNIELVPILDEIIEETVKEYEWKDITNKNIKSMIIKCK